ncbi:thermonuclease family protein, partial [Cereibacter sphaeroides]|uniref:thermonuclease family protein n=1 Tax=Cereibacter sphaeroides TaxID=1063 RepID=UPI001F20E4B5
MSTAGLASAFFLALAGAGQAAEPVPPCGVYLYRADIVRVIDGDTVVADIDLGFSMWLRDQRLRLFGIDAPEDSTEEGKVVTAAVRARVEGKSLYICSIKAKRSETQAEDSFGRYLA